jgi:hypothetical protein
MRHALVYGDLPLLHFLSHRPENITGLNILWDHGPTCIVGQLICLGPRSHLYRRSGYLLGPRSHLRHLSAYLPGTTVPPRRSLSAWDHGPTCVICQLICWDHGPTCIAGQVISWDHGPTCIVGTLLVRDNGSINACHEQVLACRQQPDERVITQQGGYYRRW